MRQTPAQRLAAPAAADLHAMGIRIVVDHLRARGILPVSVTADERYDPQIIAIDGADRVHYAVRTSWLPELGKLECDALRDELVEWAQDDGATCFLASVGITPGHRSAAPSYRLIVFPLSQRRLDDRHTRLLPDVDGGSAHE